MKKKNSDYSRSGKTIVKIVNLKKNFMLGEQEVEVLKGMDVEVKQGEFVIIFGPSGCGKSTLLHTLLGLEKPTDGKIFIEDKDFYFSSEDERAKYRKNKVGIVYQQPLWIRALDALNNVAFPLRLLGMDEDLVLAKAQKALEMVGMGDWSRHLPTELSAGQQQKVSLARALIIDPVFIAADEPTGNLDTVSGEELMETLLKLNQERRTIILITHDLEYLRYASRLFHMIDGKIIEDLCCDELRQHKLMANGKKYNHDGANINIHDPDFLKKLYAHKK